MMMKRETRRNNMSMTSFGNIILFESVRGSSEVKDPIFLKVICESNILTTIISKDRNEGCDIVFFDQTFELREKCGYIRFSLHRIEPCIFRVLINKNHIISVSIIGFLNRTPNIGVNKL